MPDLFTLMPALKHVSHPLLRDRRITAVGVSAVLYDQHGFVFEVTKPRHWGRTDDGRLIVGVGGLGGRLKPGESALTCLQREVQEEIGSGFWLEPALSTALIHQAQVAAWLDIARHPREVAPYIINLLPPQLERPDRPDHVAIVTFRGLLRHAPRRADLFGLLTIERPALKPFFERRQWSLNEALALPGLTFDLESPLPSDALLRPTLTGRAFQVLVKDASGLPSTW